MNLEGTMKNMEGEVDEAVRAHLPEAPAQQHPARRAGILKSEWLHAPVLLLRSPLTDSLSGNELSFIIQLLSFLHGAETRAPASVEFLSEYMHLDKNKVQAMLLSLESRRLITRAARGDKSSYAGVQATCDLSPLILKLMEAGSSRGDPLPLHICPRCGQAAKSQASAEWFFGYRQVRAGKKIIQSWCKGCRKQQRTP
jgi:hypothetical protein